MEIFFGYGCNCFWKTKAQLVNDQLKKEAEHAGKEYENPAGYDEEHEDE